MSRIGKLPIEVPQTVNIDYTGLDLKVTGKFGSLQLTIPESIEIVQNKNSLTLILIKKNKNIRALHGLYRTLISNMIIGVSEQFQLTLVLKGVGYRATVKTNQIILNLGYSHPVKIKIPSAISIDILQNTIINLKSCDKELLGLFASKIRLWRLPEPYKGKGILYKDEQIFRKTGKSGK